MAADVPVFGGPGLSLYEPRRAARSWSSYRDWPFQSSPLTASQVDHPPGPPSATLAPSRLVGAAPGDDVEQAAGSHVDDRR